MAAKKFAKYALTFGVGAFSGQFLALAAFKDEFGALKDIISPPTFANLEIKTPPNPRKFEWGPVTSWDYNWDKRDVVGTEQVPAEVKSTRHLILIRHGQYNLKGKSDEERYLTDLGREQALLTGKRLAELNLPWTYLVSSNMTRAQQTAGLIQQSLPEDLEILDNDSILAEGAPYPPEPPSPRWSPEERYQTDGARIEAAFRKYFHRADPEQKEDSYEVIVCHANVIRYFVCRALQLPPEAWLRISLKHASMTFVSIRPNGKVSVRGLGDAGHFPPEKLTTT